MDSPPPSNPWPALWGSVLRAPARILLSGAAALLVLAAARLAGFPPLSALLSGPPAQFAALLVFLVGIAFAAFLWWLAARSFALLRDPRTTPEQLASLRELPLALPEGTVRALLALIVGVVGLPLLLFSQALALTDATAGYVNGIIAGVFGYYFGARSTAGGDAAAAARRIGEALAGQGRQAGASREENAAPRDRAAGAAGAAAHPGQLAAALETLSRQIAIAGNLLEVLGPALPPGLVPPGAADALRRARAVAAEARALAATGEADAPAALARVSEATAALAGTDGAFASLLRAAAGALPAVAGGPLAAVSLLLGLGWQAGGAAWRRWRAQVLAAPHDPALFDAGAIAPSSAALRLDGAPLFAAAFAPLSDRPGFAADLLDIALRGDAEALLWAEHGGRFASPEAAAAGLAEFRRALLAESAAADVSGGAVQAVVAGLADAAPTLRPEGATPEAARALFAAAGTAGTEESRSALQALAMLLGLLREQKVDALRGLAELAP